LFIAMEAVFDGPLFNAVRDAAHDKAYHGSRFTPFTPMSEPGSIA
jgi:hypothetical protein